MVACATKDLTQHRPQQIGTASKFAAVSSAHACCPQSPPVRGWLIATTPPSTPSTVGCIHERWPSGTLCLRSAPGAAAACPSSASKAAAARSALSCRSEPKLVKVQLASPTSTACPTLCSH